MTVQELIDKLHELPPGNDINIFFWTNGLVPEPITCKIKDIKHYNEDESFVAIDLEQD